MNCEEVGTKMIDYLDDQLPQNEKDSIEKHLENCESCMDEIRDYQSMLQEISETRM